MDAERRLPEQLRDRGDVLGGPAATAACVVLAGIVIYTTDRFPTENETSRIRHPAPLIERGRGSDVDGVRSRKIGFDKCAMMNVMDTDELFDRHPDDYRRALRVLCEAYVNPSSTPYDVLVVLVPLLTEITDPHRVMLGAAS